MGKSKSKAIGVFDSGLGGLTVVKEIIRQLPGENIVYFGDTARVPYGTKSKESIVRFSVENSRILLQKNVKCIVVACNSSSSYALPKLKKLFSVPVIGVIEPGVKKALDMTQSGIVGLIATQATVKSNKYSIAIKKHNKNVKVFAQACPLLVPIVEEGWLIRKVTRDIIKEYLSSLMKKKIDTLILGCTHYPLLKPEIQKVVGDKIILVDSAKEVASNLKEMFEKSLIEPNGSKKKGSVDFFVSDRPQEFEKIAERFLGKKIKKVLKVTTD